MTEPNINPFNDLKFIYPWRKYQGMVLEKFANEQNIAAGKPIQQKLHIVAPPGSGKTILGIELIKRIGKPAVIFSPTSTIMSQWKDKVRMFLPEGSTLHGEIVSKDPNDLKPINTYTYQLISSPAENNQFIEEAALKIWKVEVVKNGTVPSIEEAENRLKILKEKSPKIYSQNLSKHYKKIKKQLLEDPRYDIKELLHPNARKLIQDLIDLGVKTVVLDESHHMLDYWAIVIKALLKEIGDYKLIGLTATPPLDGTTDEQENYYSLLGDIDFEVPTPAVVKEGNLAPYQDLVYFVKPTESEKKFIGNLQNHFVEFTKLIMSDANFNVWFKGVKWSVFIKTNPELALAAMKYFKLMDINEPADFPIFEEAYKPMTIDDWAELISHFSLNFLVLKEEEIFKKKYQRIKDLLRDFGYTLTERGMRRHRAPTDRILSLSESKTDAVIKILEEEQKAMGEDIRAVIVTDFENESAFSKKYFQGIVDSGSGGAIFAYEKIVHSESTEKLEAILVTGKRLLIDPDKKDEIVKSMEAWREKMGLQFELSVKESGFGHILEIEGKGKDWKSNTYVRMVTSLFEEGITKCLVGTRGLLAEGWDTLSLNTLIDLTTATTSTSVRQLRGRSLRIDPDKPKKLANNWEVVCIEPEFEKGDQDFLRFVKKHSRFYGLGKNGKIIKNIPHVDEQLYVDYMANGFKALNIEQINERMIAKSKLRSEAYQSWRVGEPYENMSFFSTQISGDDIKLKTIETLNKYLKKALLYLILGSAGIFAVWWIILFLLEILGLSWIFILISLCCMMPVSIFVFILLRIWTIGNKLEKNPPIAYYIRDIAACVLNSLRYLKLIDNNITEDSIRVEEADYGFFDVYLSRANEEDSKKFTQAFNQIFDPITEQRYLVKPGSPNKITTPFALLTYIVGNLRRRIMGQDNDQYYPVPKIFSSHKKSAIVYANYWNKFIAPAKLVYTRNHSGAIELLGQRSKKFERVKRVQLDLWK